LLVEKPQKRKKYSKLDSKDVDSVDAMYKMACLAYCMNYSCSIATKFRFKPVIPAEEMLRWVKKNLKEVSRT
jgi:hypothetical protein